MATIARQQLLIGGEWPDARSGETYGQAFPFTGDQVGVSAAAGREDARAAVDAAERRSTSGRAARRQPAARS